MFLIIGALVVIGVIYLLLKRHESRMVLIAAGILMCCIAGNPMASLDAFAKSMTNAGLITSVCSCMGFAWCMKYTGCDKHLVVAIGKVLKKMGFLLIPGATIICAGIAGVDPMEVCKRNALGITLALVVGMILLLF